MEFEDYCEVGTQKTKQMNTQPSTELNQIKFIKENWELY